MVRGPPVVVRIGQEIADGFGVEDAIVELVVDVLNIDDHRAQALGCAVIGQRQDIGVEVAVCDDDVVGAVGDCMQI